jgi:predicted O-methyltransferase YrrM
VRTHTRQVEHEVLERYVQGQRHIVELGVFEGASSLMLRKAMAIDGKLWCVDPLSSRQVWHLLSILNC